MYLLYHDITKNSGYIYLSRVIDFFLCFNVLYINLLSIVIQYITI